MVWIWFCSCFIFRQCAAEELPLADSSVDLVTAMSAFHWFDRPRFLQEAHRVLKPRGCLALLNYTIDMELSYPDCCTQTLNQVCKEVLTEYQLERSSTIKCFCILSCEHTHHQIVLISINSTLNELLNTSEFIHHDQSFWFSPCTF